MLKLKSLPKKPGVYFFKNADGKIIYIGKALSLKNRVGNYFRQKPLDPKTQNLVAEIKDIKTIVVPSEFEALLLEAQAIKQYSPKYNVNLKDDKSYLYIVIGKEYPNRVFLARRPEIQFHSVDWYGPFTTAADARQILKIVRKIFPFRSCKTLPKKPCLYYHLKLCFAPCFFANEDYSQTIAKIRQIFSGKINPLIDSLAKEMKNSAKDQEFEKAQIIKKRIESLKSITANWQSVPKEFQKTSKTLLQIKKFLEKYQKIAIGTLNRIEGYDVSNLGKEIIVGAMVVFVNGMADKSQYRKFNLKYNLTSQNDPEGIKRIIQRRLAHQEWLYPQLILIDGGKTQIGAAFASLKEKNLEDKIAVLGLTKEEETILIPQIAARKIASWKSLKPSRNSPVLQLLQQIRDESHRFAQRYYKTVSAKKMLTK